jgi:hypothetical protein
MLKSTKDRVLVVDTSGQQVLPHVWYKMTCLLIRVAVESVPCLDEWKIDIVTHPGSHVAREAVVLQLPRETLAMVRYCVLP